MKINATVTRYDAEPEFNEAAHYDEFCAAQLTELFPGYEISVEFGPVTRAHVYGGDADQDAITSLLKVELWDSFCADGYKEFAPSA